MQIVKTGIAALLLSTAGSNALDLTPQRSQRELEGGVIVPMLAFSHENQTAKYAPPSRWQVTGSPTLLEMRPPDAPQSLVRISVQPRTPKSGSVDDSGAAELSSWVDRLLPADVQGLERGAINASPFTLGTIPSREYQFAYSLHEQQFCRSVSVVDLNSKERMVVEVSARKKDFERVRDSMVRSLFSWQWLTETPTPEAP